MRKHIAAATVALLLLITSAAAALDDPPHEVRSLASVGWAGSEDEGLRATVPLHSAYVFTFTTYCHDPMVSNPYVASVEGMGVRDTLEPGRLIARDSLLGPYTFEIEVIGDTEGCSWAIFIDSESDDSVEGYQSAERALHFRALESATRRGANPVKCSSFTGSALYFQAEAVPALDETWTCTELDTFAEEQARIERERIEQENLLAAAEAKRAEEAAEAEAKKAEEEALEEAERAAREEAEARRSETLAAMPPPQAGWVNCVSLDGVMDTFEANPVDLDDDWWECDLVECRGRAGGVVRPEDPESFESRFPQFTCGTAGHLDELGARAELLAAMSAAPKGQVNCVSSSGDTRTLKVKRAQALDESEWMCDGL